MPIDAYAVTDVRAAENASPHLADGTLMRRASTALANLTAGLLRDVTGGVYARSVVLLIGPGANGGDALWAGTFLRRRGAAVTAVLCSDSVWEPGLEALRAAGGRVVLGQDPLVDRLLAGADVVLDGLLGIGGRPGLRPPASRIAEFATDAIVIAVDLPSGVDPDTGELSGACIHADLTVTFGTAKPCLLLPPAAGATGPLATVDIGLDMLGARPLVRRLETSDVPGLWPVPGVQDDKYARGVVGVVAGGSSYPGAAVLCCRAAVAAGAGMVRYSGPADAADAVRRANPEVVTAPGQVQAWALGPGVDPDDEDQCRAVAAALREDLPAVVDAGALSVLAEMVTTDQHVNAPVLATPHAGELATLLSALDDTDVTREQVLAAPLKHARRAAGRTGATVLLKGPVTLVVPPTGPCWSQADAPAWLGTAGAGDVLAGLAATLLAAGLDPADAGALAALTHGVAAHVAGGGGPCHAGAVADALPTVITMLLDPDAELPEM